VLHHYWPFVFKNNQHRGWHSIWPDFMNTKARRCSNCCTFESFVWKAFGVSCLEGFWSELFGQQACMGRKAAENHHIWRAEITLNLFFWSKTFWCWWIPKEVKVVIKLLTHYTISRNWCQWLPLFTHTRWWACLLSPPVRSWVKQKCREMCGPYQ
jgi:hypothetical protein